MTLKIFANKLRRAADVLDELLNADINDHSSDGRLNGSVEMAASVRKGIRKVRADKGKARKAKKAKQVATAVAKGTSKKGYSYKGKHWTQRPENADKLQALIRRSTGTRRGVKNTGAVETKTPETPTAETPTPETVS